MHPSIRVITIAAALAAGSTVAFAAGNAAKGKEVFDQCSVCHNADSTERKIGPGLKGLFKRDKLTDGKAVNEANVRTKINEGGNGMPGYKDILSDQEKDDVIAYLKTL
ncbi:MAG: c-type cytochrome [Acidobacteriia bacterium]|nr:c-type cytochrome [Terriglobia bacterium]